MLDEADELYGLPDDEFTAARDALAKRLRAEKRREEADEVKALRRPNVVAGAINRAVREHGADDLLAAGEALREAHEALLSGDGDAAGVREATAREREAVRELARLALGDGASESTAEKVRATLHAASVDEDVRERLAAGRLERDAEAGVDTMALLAGGGGGGGGGAKPSRAPARKPARSSPPKPDRSRGGTTTAPSKPSEAERRREKAAERAREEAERAVAAQAEAEAAAERARAALAEAEEAARKARAVVEDLEGHERAARRAVKEAEADAERRRTEARRAVKAAESRA
jgi:hypothetical protein